jgi:hypothetical protein
MDVPVVGHRSSEPKTEICERVYLFILFTHTYLDVVSQVPVEGQETNMRERERETEREKVRKRERKRDRETLLTSFF